MRLLTRTQYDAICDIIKEQKKRIEEMEDQLDDMRSQRDRLQQIVELYSIGSATNIDFPNSHTVVKPDTRDQWR